MKSAPAAGRSSSLQRGIFFKKSAWMYMAFSSVEFYPSLLPGIIVTAACGMRTASFLSKIQL